jgi:NitT/TauT family transport system substrate-binding protein
MSPSSPFRRVSRRAILAVVCLPLWAGLAQAADTINVRFSWKLKGEYAAFYVAQEKNYYAEQGVTVTMGEGSGAPAALGALLQGQEDAVVLPGIYALTAISKGMPIRLIALYHPLAPVGFLSRPDNPVRVPKDLEGKSVATSAGDTTVEYLPLLCQRNNIDCSKIKRVRGDVGVRVPQVLSKQVDAASTYLNVDPPVLESQNLDLVVFDAAKFGLQVPGMAIVSTDKLIREKSGPLRAFLRAVDKGFAESRKDPEGAARMLLKSWSGGPSVPVVTQQVRKTMEFTPVSTTNPLGWVEAAVIRSALDDMAKLNPGENISQTADSYYTNALLGEARK